MTPRQKIVNILKLSLGCGYYHGEGMRIESSGLKKVSIVGSPNVGKSAIFPFTYYSTV